MKNAEKKSEELCELNNIEYYIPSNDKINEYVNIFKAMSDPTRLSILYLLENNELCSCKIQTSLNKAQPTISHHINILKNAKLIKGRKKGTWIYYSLTNPNIIKIIEQLNK